MRTSPKRFLQRCKPYVLNASMIICAVAFDTHLHVWYSVLQEQVDLLKQALVAEKERSQQAESSVAQSVRLSVRILRAHLSVPGTCQHRDQYAYCNLNLVPLKMVEPPAQQETLLRETVAKYEDKIRRTLTSKTTAEAEDTNVPTGEDFDAINASFREGVHHAQEEVFAHHLTGCFICTDDFVNLTLGVLRHRRHYWLRGR